MTASAAISDVSNCDVQRAIAKLVADRMQADSCAAAVGSLRQNFYSFTFPIDWDADNGSAGVFVKIPKTDVRHAGATILPVSTADGRMYSDEVRSLRRLAEAWKASDLRVHWVRLIDAFPEFNAIVTERVFADEALDVFRRLDLRRRLGFRKDADRLRDAMARIGAALGRFHRRDAADTVFRGSDATSKLVGYCHALKRRGAGRVPDAVIEALARLGSYETRAVSVPTLKGIDIRNVLIDQAGGMFLLDPGRMKTACREADIARFLMTFRILFWGSPVFVLRIRPDADAERAFLDAYYAECGHHRDEVLLSYFFLKEQLKHWHTALASLESKRWPSALKRLVGAIYVHPFYSHQINCELRRLIR